MSGPNPDTHCLDCAEPLSEYGHCWQHHYPPMDPKQDEQQTADDFEARAEWLLPGTAAHAQALRQMLKGHYQANSKQ